MHILEWDTELVWRFGFHSLVLPTRILNLCSLTPAHTPTSKNWSVLVRLFLRVGLVAVHENKPVDTIITALAS